MSAARKSAQPLPENTRDLDIARMKKMPIALTIAGSDSGGGAGIQADLKTFSAFRVFGTSAVTAITVQNTLGVTGIHTVPSAIVRAQINAIKADLPPDACKSGMLATAELVSVVARALQDHVLERYVLDPVMVASSGDRLLDQDAEAMLRQELLPLALVVTPNLDEASILCGFAVADVPSMRRAARALVDLGARSALVKGGHLRSGRIIDVLFDGVTEHSWERDRIDTRSTHGTGCTLSAALTAGLARGASLVAATAAALDYVQRALQTAPGLGQGHGPLNHFVDPDVPGFTTE